MGAIIYVSGEGTIYGKKNIEELNKIKNGWGFPAFEFSKTGCGFEFSEATMEGSNPYEDGVLKPLNSLIAYAKKTGLTVDAEFTITSDWSDYDNIEVIIEDNILSTGNSEIINASTEELEAELKRRNRLEFKMLDRREIRIDTPAGTIVAETKGAFDEYPGIYITVQNDGAEELIGCAEYETTTNNFQMCCYQFGKGEPVAIINAETGEQEI